VVGLKLEDSDVFVCFGVVVWLYGIGEVLGFVLVKYLIEEELGGCDFGVCVADVVEVVVVVGDECEWVVIDIGGECVD